MPTVKHVDGTVCQVDDELAKKLSEDGSNIWTVVRAPKKAAAKDADTKE